MRWSVKLLRKEGDNLFKIRYIQLNTKQHNVLVVLGVLFLVYCGDFCSV